MGDNTCSVETDCIADSCGRGNPLDHCSGKVINQKLMASLASIWLAVITCWKSETILLMNGSESCAELSHKVGGHANSRDFLQTDIAAFEIGFDVEDFPLPVCLNSSVALLLKGPLGSVDTGPNASAYSLSNAAKFVDPKNTVITRPEKSTLIGEGFFPKTHVLAKHAVGVVVPIAKQGGFIVQAGPTEHISQPSSFDCNQKATEVPPVSWQQGLPNRRASRP